MEILGISKGGRMTKYRPLINFLLKQDLNDCELAFAEIESITGSRLPASARHYPAFWSRGNALGKLLAEAGWRAQPKFSERRIRFIRVSVVRTEGVRPAPANIAAAAQTAKPDLVLLGCVKEKLPGRHPAKDLYISTLFRGRRAWAESTGKPWYVLSAKLGLVAPDEVIDTYDVELSKLSFAARRNWSEKVLRQLDQRVGDLRGKVVEIHSGSAYRDSGVITGLKLRGAKVQVPLLGLRFGEQLAWYADHVDGWWEPERAGPEGTIETVAVPAKPEIRDLARQLTGDFKEGRLDFSGRRGAPKAGWDAMPEFVAVRHISAAGAEPPTVRTFLTLVAALDRARDADRLWLAAAALYEKNPWVFDCLAVAQRGLVELRDVLAEGGVSQRHTIDSAAWRTIAEALVSAASPVSIKLAVTHGRGDAKQLLEDLKATTQAGQPWFPYLSGPKVSVMWVRMLAAPGEATITSLNELPVAVDVQVRKVSEYLGVTETGGMALERARPIIQEAWHAASNDAVGPAGISGTGAALDPALWFFAKWGCSYCEREGKQMPISAVCDGCRY